MMMFFFKKNLNLWEMSLCLDPWICEHFMRQLHYQCCNCFTNCYYSLTLVLVLLF